MAPVYLDSVRVAVLTKDMERFFKNSINLGCTMCSNKNFKRDLNQWSPTQRQSTYMLRPLAHLITGHESL